MYRQSDDTFDSLSPAIDKFWVIAKKNNPEEYFLVSKNNPQHCHEISLLEAHILNFFTGKFSLRFILEKVSEKQDSQNIEPLFLDLITKLIEWEIIQSTSSEEGTDDSEDFFAYSALKSCVDVIKHNDGHFLLRNSENMAFIQVDSLSHEAISLLGTMPNQEICQRLDIVPTDLRDVIEKLARTEMLVGSKAPVKKSGKWTPFQMLYVKKSMINPDRWLNLPAKYLSWIWTKFFFLSLCLFLIASLIIALRYRAEILYTGNLLLQTYGGLLLLPFVSLVILVVTIHELGHALTLKHYGGEVREMGLLFMFLIPAVYTNSTDAYQCQNKRQRIFVVAAGVICQCVIAAIAFWLWYFAVDNSWLKPTSYLLLVASLFTLILNLNPMAKFDGYHLLTAMTGINNLRDRSFQFYRDLFKNSSHEPSKIRWILLIYAPLSFIYIFFVMGSMFRLVTFWILDNAGSIFIFLLIAWLVYYFFPRPNVHQP